MPYLSVNAIADAINHIATTYPAITQIIALPEPSVEGRQIRALKIAHGGGSTRTGVLFLGGTHARELVNPETVLSFAMRLCDAYTNNTGLTFGPKAFAPSAIQTVVNALDIFMVPLVNPDGRHFCLMPGGDRWWRKNRSNHAGLPCRGVDLNRNYDFLWSSGIGTSGNSCADIFKGPGAFSEPETRNVRRMIDTFTNLACLIDIHSYSELVLYPWGDDENQTTDPNQNFQNPAFDGQRGVVGSGYKEYIPSGDLQDYVALAVRIRDGIAAVRGRVYTAQQSIALYPTTATTHDYAYARHFIDTGRRRVLGLTLETAREFQPADVEKNNVIREVSAGLMESLLETLCPADVVQGLFEALFPLRAMRRFRDRYMLKTAAGARYDKMFRAHSLELAQLAIDDKPVRDAGAALLRIAGRFFNTKHEVLPRKIAAADLTETNKALAVVRKPASQKLKAAIGKALADLKRLQGKPLTDAFKALDALEGGAKAKKTRPSAKMARGKGKTTHKNTGKKTAKKRPRS
jgi:carboxypeptidase T